MSRFTKAIKLFASLPFLVISSGVFSLQASASSQTVSSTLDPVTAGSSLASLLTASSSYTYLEPLSSTQTQVTPENEGHWYGWTFDPFDSLPCSEAVPQTVRIRANNALTSEGNPDWSVMILGSTDGAAVDALTPQRPVIEGYSPDGAPVYVGRWSLGSEAFPPATSDWAIGIAGQMEAVWDISTLESGKQLALGSGHDAEDGTTGLQTTIESVEVTYDTTECNSITSPTTPAPTTPPTTPKTGAVINIVILTAVLIASLAILAKGTNHLKSKH